MRHMLISRSLETPAIGRGLVVGSASTAGRARSKDVRRPAGIGARPARPRLDGLEAALPVPVQQPVQVPTADPYSAAEVVTDSCAETTLRTATWCFDMPKTVTHVPTHPSPIRCHLYRGLRHFLASQHTDAGLRRQGAIDAMGT
jgi:hypothetical protein